MGQRRNNSNIKFSDNNYTTITFDNLETGLNQNDLSFGDFNNTWYYIEEDYNNR